MKELPRVHPFFNRTSWHGKIFALDDTPINDFDENSLEQVIHSGESGDTWDGDCAAICRLKDGRIIAWETNWGPTGDGFSEDAYGGDADIFVCRTVEDAIRFGLSPQGRGRCGVTL